MQKKTLLLVLLFAVLFDFTGCVSMNPQTRREQAYRHYVQKQAKQRKKAMARQQKAANREMKRKMKTIQPSEQQVTTSVGNATEYPAVFDAPSASTSVSEPVAPPVTVSLTSPSASQSGNEPAQP